MEGGARRGLNPHPLHLIGICRKMKTLIFFSLPSLAEHLEIFLNSAVQAAVPGLWPSQHKLYQDSTKFTFPKKNAQAFKVR